ncbi:MAG: hypothetical protein ACLR4Z_10095 [Butyricicoccaceae bacterium]
MLIRYSEHVLVVTGNYANGGAQVAAWTAFAAICVSYFLGRLPYHRDQRDAFAD